MCLAFALGFVFGVVCEYFWQAHAPEVPEQRHIREAEDAAATAWDNV